MHKMSVRKLAFSAAVGAIYAVLTMVLAPISYGMLQFRLSEALCILPFFFPVSAWGLFVGCLIANLLSPVGLLDIVFGSLATLLAGLCTAAIGKRDHGSWPNCILACLMPVLFNAFVIGAILAYTGTGSFFSPSALSLFAVCALEVGAGELAVLFLVGLPLMRILPRQAFFRKLSEQAEGH